MSEEPLGERLRNNESFVAHITAHGQRVVVPVDPTLPDLPIVLTVAEAADVLSTSPASIRLAIENDELPAMVFHGRQRIVVSLLLDRMEAAEIARQARYSRHQVGLG